MPFDVNTAKVDQSQPSGGFDVGTAQVITSAQTPEETTFREETGEVIKAPSVLSAPEIEYMDDTQNRGDAPQVFLGFAKVGVDHVAATGKGLVNFLATVPATLEGSARMQMGDPYAEALSRPFKASDIFSFLPNPFSSRDEAISNATIDRIFLDRSGEREKIEKAQALSRSGRDLIRRNQEWVARNGFQRPEDGSEAVAFDIGNVGGSIGASIGLAMLTRSPAMSAIFFGELQKSDAYVEARDKGFSPGSADAISSAMGVVEGGLEFVGVNYFLEAAGTHKGLKLIGFRMLEEALQEGSQQSGEEIITQTSGLRELDVKGGVGRVLYSMMLGAVGGGTVAGTIEVGKRVAKEEGVNEEIVPILADKIEENSGDIDASMAEILDQEASPIRENDQISAQTAQIMRDFAEGKPIDTTKLSEQDRKIVVESLGSEVDQQLRILDAQQGRNLLPVPKRPETLSQFIKSKGGLKIDTGEAQRYTKKEMPQLRGVAHKNGKLSLDEALGLAIEEGFVTDTAYEDGVSIADIQTFLDALEAESRGADIVRASDLSAVMDRNAIIELNSQQDQANQELLSNTKEIKGLRAALRAGVKAAKTDVKKSQEAIIGALEKSGLRSQDRAKFIRSIKNIQTPEQLHKSIPEIEARVTDLIDAETKRNLRDRIKKLISTAKGSKDVAVDTVDEVKELERRFQNKGILTGANKADPDLDGKNPPAISDLTVFDFEIALGEASAMLLKGKAKLFLLKEMKKQRRAQRLEDLEQDSVPIDNRELERADIGERLSIFDRLKNVYIEGSNRAQRLSLNKNPMDVIFDIMDGYKNYHGANSRVFKRTIDKAYHRFLNLKEDTTREVKALSDELGFDDKNYERIGAWAAYQQEGGYEKLKQSGITDQELEKLEKRYENGGINEEAKNELRMYNLMREKLDSLRPALKEVMRLVYNKDFKNVKEYFPFMTDFKAMNGLEIQEMFGDDAFVIGDERADFNKKDVKKGFTEERKGGKQKIRIDAMGVFLNHVENATYLIEMGQDIKELGELAASNDFEGIAGDLGQQITVDWINLLARKGNMSGQIDFLNQLRVNTGAAVLGFKISSALIQPTALMDGAAFVGGDYVTRGIFNVTQGEWRDFLYKNMPEIRERVGDDPAYLEMGGKSLIAHTREAGFWVLKRLDLMAASAVASGAYVKSVEERGGTVDLSNPDPLALEEAQLAVRRSQSSSFAKDAAPILSQGKLTGNVSVDKLILQFQSFLLNRWSLIEHDMYNAGVKQGKTLQATNIATWLILANFAEFFIRNWTKELIAAVTGYEPPEDDKSIAEKTIRQAISNVPVVSSLVNSAQYGTTPVPAISLVESVADSLKYAQQSKSEEKKIKHYSQAAIVATGLFGVPGVLQAKQISRGLFDDGEKKTSGKSKVFNP